MAALATPARHQCNSPALTPAAGSNSSTGLSRESSCQRRTLVQARAQVQVWVLALVQALVLVPRHLIRSASAPERRCLRMASTAVVPHPLPPAMQLPQTVQVQVVQMPKWPVRQQLVPRRRGRCPRHVLAAVLTCQPSYHRPACSPSRCSVTLMTRFTRACTTAASAGTPSTPARGPSTTPCAPAVATSPACAPASCF